MGNMKDRLLGVTVFYMKKINKLQPVPPSMSLDALLRPDNVTDSASDEIDGRTGCNFIFFLSHRIHSPGHIFGNFGIKFRM